MSMPMSIFQRLTAAITNRFHGPGRLDWWAILFLWVLPLLVAILAVSWFAPPGLTMPLSPGDRVQVLISEGEEFSGGFVLDHEGAIALPYLGALSVAGLEPPMAAQVVTTALVAGGYFRPNFAQVSLQVIAWAPIEVAVRGETFEPGRVLINPPRLVTAGLIAAKETVGDATPERFLTAAIRSAGGVTPRADVTRVRLIRGKLEKTIDLSGMFEGTLVNDIPLIAGDQVIVPRADQFQVRLVRPSQITPPGIKVLISNLTVPANNNASSALGSGGSGGVALPYGSRFSHAVLAGNCAGGTQATNANRYAMLVRADLLTGQTQTIERPIEEILRNSTDKDNPQLLPNDGVACYDSALTNTRDVLRTVLDFLNPLNLLFGAGGLFRSLR